MRAADFTKGRRPGSVRCYRARVNTGLTVGLARRWMESRQDRRWRGALVIAGVAAFAASIAGDTDPCSVADPSVCGPDLGFSLAVVGAFGATLLVWWWPLAAAACAVAFAGLDLAFDDVPTAQIAWPALAALHLWHVIALRRAQGAQVALASRASAPIPPSARPAVGGTSPGLTSPIGPSHVAVGALLLAALVCAGVLLGVQAAERDHEARARDLSAQVVGVDNEGTTRVRTDAAVPGIPQEVNLETRDTYEVGDPVLLRVDPQDPGWAHLAAEPPDPTWWATLSLGALLIASVFGQQLLAGRARRGMLREFPPTEGLPVRWLVDEDLVAVLCVDRDVVAAEFDVLPRPRPEVEPRLEAAVQPGWLVGDLRPGGWCGLIANGEIELPIGRLLALPDLPRIDDASLDPDLADDLRAWTDPVPESAVPARFPVRLGPSSRETAVGYALALGATAAGWWALGWSDLSWHEVVVLAGLSGRLLYFGLTLASSAIRVDAAGVTLIGTSHVRRVPIREVLDVRVSEDLVVLELPDDEIVDLGPFSEPTSRWARLLRGPATRGEPAAVEVAAALDDARVAAGSVHAPSEEQLSLRGRLGPGLPWLVLAAALILGRAVWALQF